jgi:hypothetical protein
MLKKFGGKLSFLRSKLLIGLYGLLAITIAGSVWYRSLQRPGVGSIQATTQVQAEQKPVAPTEPNHFEGKTLLFDYPAAYSDFQNKPGSLPVVETYSFKFYDQSSETRRISITIKQPAPGDIMTDDSAYVFRKNQADTYEISDLSLDIGQLKKLVKADKTEITYFVPGDKYYAIVTATTTRPTGGMADDVFMTVSSLQWVQ